MINHTVKIDITTGFTPNYIQMLDLPVIATRIVGLSAFAPQSLDAGNNYEIELVLNDDRHHIAQSIETTGSSAENYAGVQKCDVPIIRNAKHMVILRNIAKVTLHFLLETINEKTCQDEQA